MFAYFNSDTRARTWLTWVSYCGCHIVSEMIRIDKLHIDSGLSGPDILLLISRRPISESSSSAESHFTANILPEPSLYPTCVVVNSRQEVAYVGISKHLTAHAWVTLKQFLLKSESWMKGRFRWFTIFWFRSRSWRHNCAWYSSILTNRTSFLRLTNTSKLQLFCYQTLKILF